MTPVPDLPTVQPQLVAAATLTVLAELGRLVALLALCVVIDHLADGSSPTAPAVTALVCWIAAAVLSPLADALAHRAEARYEARLRRRLTRHILTLPWSIRSRYPAETLRTRVDGDVRALHHLVAHAPADITTFLVLPVTGIVLLVTLAGTVSLLALIPAAVAAVFHIVVIPRVSTALDARRVTAVINVVSAADDYARTARIQRLYGSGAGAAGRYRNHVATFARAMTAWVNRSAPAAALASGLLQASSTLAVGYLVAHDWSAGDLARVLLLGLSVTGPALQLGHGVDHIRSGLAAGQRITALLDDGTSPTTGAAPAAPAPGSFTVVTGPSGAGKSTLLRSLAGLDGPGFTTRDPDVLPHSTLLIGQDAGVLDASVRDNLRLTAPDASDDTLRDALTRASADVLSLDAPATVLSGGEKQRLNLARAFLTDAPVILLDEPTSALDTATAHRVVAALRELPQTVVMVTHDTSLIEPTDQRQELY